MQHVKNSCTHINIRVGNVVERDRTPCCRTLDNFKCGTVPEPRAPFPPSWHLQPVTSTKRDTAVKRQTQEGQMEV
eukprot:1141438-Pelagomonas_calceolata.AAC.3